MFFYRLKKIADDSADLYSKLVVVGILAWFGVQTVVNIGSMLGVLPLKGITLPFISYGGTSLLFVMAASGVVFRLSHYTIYEPTSRYRGQKVKRTRDGYNIVMRRGQRGAYNASLSGR